MSKYTAGCALKLTTLGPVMTTWALLNCTYAGPLKLIKINDILLRSENGCDGEIDFVIVA